MKELPTLTALVDSFSKLPGVGVRTAERMAYAVLGWDPEKRAAFSDAINAVTKKVRRCPDCGLYCEGEKCEICLDETRDRSTIVVVADARDVYAIEKMNSYHGLYHVLGGLISASKGVAADDIAIDKLIKRVEENAVKEVIIATDPTLDGQTTGLYIAKLLEGEKDLLVTRLGYGLPMGSSLDYADSLTLSKAFEGRKKI
jgi:recombination protein RecR